MTYETSGMFAIFYLEVSVSLDETEQCDCDITNLHHFKCPPTSSVLHVNTRRSEKQESNSVDVESKSLILI